MNSSYVAVPDADARVEIVELKHRVMNLEKEFEEEKRSKRNWRIFCYVCLGLNILFQIIGLSSNNS